MELYNNILCIEGGWLLNEGVIGESNYKQHILRGKFNQLRRACKGQTALIAYDSIPERFKSIIREKLGADPYELVKDNFFKQYIKPDQQALDFYNDYKLDDGRFLPPDTITEYYHNAIILNAVHRAINNRMAKRKGLGGGKGNAWEKMVETVAELQGYKHSLPTNVRRFREKYTQYINEGYISLVHKGFLNDNRRKVNEQIEQVLISISSMPNRLFNKTVADYYNDFVNCKIDLYDTKTGEMFDPADFLDKEGNPLTISEGTVWNVLNSPANRPVLDKMRNSSIDFKTKTMPYNHRHRPQFTLSKISMDDRALPRKGVNGWVNAYYAYDVASECFIGYSHGRDKDMGLVWDCFRNMYQTLKANNLPWPGEVEVENHLMKGISDALYSMFAWVRFCNPQNSREKRAEHAIRSKKYGDEKKHQPNIGRWTAKHDAYAVNTDVTQQLTDAQLIADDIESIKRYNNAPHSIYEKKSRWQVLCEMVNPEMTQANERIIYRYIGEETKTSIRNNDFVRVQYADYAIDTIDILSYLKPNNYDVKAYWLPDADGAISKVYLYQDEEYLGEADKIETYNEAQCERTERDEEIRINQAKRQATARKYVADVVENKVVKIGIVEKTNYNDLVDVDPVADVQPKPEPAYSDFGDESADDYYLQRALNDL